MNRSLPLLALAPFLVATAPAEFQFYRPILALKGWTELEVPEDVLERTRPGLADLRIRSERGEDVPYADRTNLPSEVTRLPVLDAETSPGRETTALVDRGDRPGWADSADLEVTETEFIKPVTLEGSVDRTAWTQIAKGSIFRTGSGPSMTAIHFSPNDRRYWRFRFDDRNGPPVHPKFVSLGPSAERHERRSVPLEFKAESDADLGVSTYVAELPCPNLPVSELRMDASDPAFSRKVRVFERVLFRDEVTRRLLGEGQIMEAPGGGQTTGVAIAEPTGKHLEIDIDRAGGLPLHVTAVSVVAEPRTLVFYAPDDRGLELVYGSSAASRPNYDLAGALAKGLPKGIAAAKVGAAVDTGAAAPAIREAPRGGSLDAALWRAKQPVVLPPRGPVAYLDVDRGDGSLADVRIVDLEGRQVPYLVEAKPRKREAPLAFHLESVGRQTELRVTGLEPDRWVEGLEIDVSSPDYFSREVTVVEVGSDARGPTGERTLGAGRLEQSAGAPRAPHHVSIARPSRGDVVVRVMNGDNAPLTVTAIRAVVLRRRLNFVFVADDRLTLLSDNPLASPAKYDLALVAERVLSSPAEPARLGDLVRTVQAEKKTPPWFWVFVLGAALVLLWAVARALRTELPKNSSP